MINVGETTVLPVTQLYLNEGTTEQSLPRLAGQASTDKQLSETNDNVKVVYIISRQTQYIVIDCAGAPLATEQQRNYDPVYPTESDSGHNQQQAQWQPAVDEPVSAQEKTFVLATVTDVQSAAPQNHEKHVTFSDHTSEGTRTQDSHALSLDELWETLSPQDASLLQQVSTHMSRLSPTSALVDSEELGDAIYKTFLENAGWEASLCDPAIQGAIAAIRQCNDHFESTERTDIQHLINMIAKIGAHNYVTQYNPASISYQERSAKIRGKAQRRKARRQETAENERRDDEAVREMIDSIVRQEATKLGLIGATTREEGETRRDLPPLQRQVALEHEHPDEKVVRLNCDETQQIKQEVGLTGGEKRKEGERTTTSPRKQASTDEQPSPVKKLVHHSRTVMEQVDCGSDCEYDEDYPISNGVTEVMASHEYCQAYDHLVEVLVSTGLHPEDANDEAVNTLLEVICSTLPDKNFTDAELEDYTFKGPNALQRRQRYLEAKRGDKTVKPRTNPMLDSATPGNSANDSKTTLENQLWDRTTIILQQKTPTMSNKYELVRNICSTQEFKAYGHWICQYMQTWSVYKYSTSEEVAEAAYDHTRDLVSGFVENLMGQNSPPRQPIVEKQRFETSPESREDQHTTPRAEGAQGARPESQTNTEGDSNEMKTSFKDDIHENVGNSKWWERLIAKSGHDETHPSSGVQNVPHHSGGQSGQSGAKIQWEIAD